MFIRIKYQLCFGIPTIMIITSYSDYIFKYHPMAHFGIILLACYFGLFMGELIEAIKGNK